MGDLELAFLAGGRRRAAEAAVVRMYVEGRVTLQQAGILSVSGRSADGELDRAAFRGVGSHGSLSSVELVKQLARHPAMKELRRNLRSQHLLTRGGVPRLTHRGRILLRDHRRQLELQQPAPLPTVVALRGPEGLDDLLRRTLLGRPFTRPPADVVAEESVRLRRQMLPYEEKWLVSDTWFEAFVDFVEDSEGPRRRRPIRRQR